MLGKMERFVHFEYYFLAKINEIVYCRATFIWFLQFMIENIVLYSLQFCNHIRNMWPTGAIDYSIG